MSMIRPRPLPPFELKERTAKPRFNARQKRINPRGRKTTEWENTRARLKVRFRRAGITECEIKLPQCWRNSALSFAHTKKRADIASQRELEEVVLSCAACHTAVEGMKKEAMYKLLKKMIAKRAVQP